MRYLEKTEKNYATCWLRLAKWGMKKLRRWKSPHLSLVRLFSELVEAHSVHRIWPCALLQSEIFTCRVLHVSKCIPCELLRGLEQECPQGAGLDMHQPLPDFALLTRINKRRHTEISNVVRRQVSKLAKVNENLLVVLYQALCEVKMHHINYFQQKWVLGAIQSQL